jgi:hypothetical protein
MQITDYFTPAMLTTSNLFLNFRELKDVAHVGCLMRIARHRGELVVNAVVDPGLRERVTTLLDLPAKRTPLTPFPEDRDTTQEMIVVVDLGDTLQWWLVTSYKRSDY